MHNALFIGWQLPKAGRELVATKVFGEWVELLGVAQKRGDIASFTPVFLEPHGGDLGGFFLVTGEPEKLAKWSNSEEFNRAQTRAMVTVDNMGFIRAFTGDRIGSQMALYQQTVAELAK